MKLLTLTLLFCVPILVLGAQAQTYRITPAITPSTVIDGQVMSACRMPDAITVSPSGNLAFVTYCMVDQFQNPQMVVTSHHIIAKDDDVVDGRTIQILGFYPIATNNRGQVAYTIMWVPQGKDPLDDKSVHYGICIDRHFVEEFGSDLIIRSLTLTDDGKVSFNQPSPLSVSRSAPTQPQTSSAIPGVLRQIPLKPPPFKLPKNFPVSIPPIPKPSSLPSLGNGTPVVTSALPMFTTDSRGQLVIPANLPDGHFVILLASPVN
jgi:hypothetical protein